jgi:ABC-type transport system involved in cytochrome c biogenesis permease subunit
LYHWISTAAVFLLFAFLPLARCEGQQAPKATSTATATTATDSSQMSDEDLAKAIDQATASRATQPWTAGLVQFLTTSVLAFGLLVIFTMAILVLRNSPTGDVLRLFTVPMVIVAAVFLVVTGFSDRQITPVIGLLGTLAGYVLGVQSQKAGSPTPTPPAPPAPAAGKGGAAPPP